MKELAGLTNFFTRVRNRMRYGELSRMPLVLLRVEWKGDLVECDWLMRESDPWDRDLPAHQAEEHLTSQALKDALDLREIVFQSFPAVTRANLRMFRGISEDQRQLKMAGTLDRSDDITTQARSLAMRAKLCGFHFNLTRGALETLIEECDAAPLHSEPADVSFTSIPMSDES